jgi:hypothetical protein
MRKPIVTGAFMVAALASSTAQASEKDIAIANCSAPHGTIAVTDGDTQGWTKFGLGSPRDLLGAMVRESNCFTVHDPASGKPADYLMSAIAGDKAVVLQGMNVARAALTEGALRSGALGAVPGLGAAMGMFNGFGGKKKIVAAGLRVLSPATGLTLLVGQGEASKSQLTWGDWSSGGSGTLGQYTSSKDGKLLSGAFAEAYNQIVAQAGTLPAPATAPAK